MREQEYHYYLKLRAKFPKAAILTEVTIPDEQAEEIYRSARAKVSPYYRRHYKKNGLSFDAEVPEGYDFTKAKLSRRIDYLIFEGSRITAVEMKVSKADFRRDTEEKRQVWKRVVNRFIYLTPEGLLKPEEIPEGCGLWEVNSVGKIVSVKRSAQNPEPEPMPQSMLKYFAWRAFMAERIQPNQPRNSSRRKRR